MLEEITIKPEVSRAKVLLKRILDNKDENHDKILATKYFKTFARTTVFVAIDSTSNAKYVDNLDRTYSRAGKSEFKVFSYLSC